MVTVSAFLWVDSALVMLDNTKAFDRLQHGFMFDTLAAFNLPKGLIDAVRTLYNGAQTKVKLNGVTGSEFDNTSGVKQGCPLSPYLFLIVMTVLFHDLHAEDHLNTIRYRQ